MEEFEEYWEDEMEEILTISPEELECISKIREVILSKVGGVVLGDISDISKDELLLKLDISSLNRTDYIVIDRKTLTMKI